MFNSIKNFLNMLLEINIVDIFSKDYYKLGYMDQELPMNVDNFSPAWFQFMNGKKAFHNSKKCIGYSYG